MVSKYKIMVFVDEIWRKSVVPGSEKLYVSNRGEIRYPSGRITKGTRKYQEARDVYIRVVCIGPRDIQKQFKVHRLVCFAFHGDTHREWLDSVDHINQDPEDNRASNLRFTTSQLNAYNTRKSKGFTKRGEKFEAQIMYNGQNHTKTFDTERAARDWYLMKRAEFVKMAEAELEEIEVLRSRLLSSLNCAS